MEYEYSKLKDHHSTSFLPDRSRVVVRHMLERQASVRPHKEFALFEDGERWTYFETLEAAYLAANSLSGQGIGRGENVLIFLPNNQAWIRAWLGVTCLGAVMVPVNPAFKGEMLKHVCKDSGAEHIIATPDLAERFEAFGLDLKVIDPETLKQGKPDEPKLEKPVEPWDTHGIVYTSGTTGPSKGVVISYLMTHMVGFRYGDRATEEDTFLIDLPLFHVAGTSAVYAMLHAGGRILVRSMFSGSRYWDIVRESGVTMSALVGSMPAFLAATSPKPDDADNPLRVVMSAPLMKDPDVFMKRFGIEDLYTAFGSTELSTVFMTFGPVGSPKTCGKVRPGIEVRLVDEHDMPMPTGKPGELIVRTDRPWEIITEYWRRPEETARAWRNGWFHTGDMFICDEAGNYFFVDRKKDTIRRRGENISSFEVEREVMAFPGVQEAACVAHLSENGEGEVKVFVLPREGIRFDPAELIRFLIPRMPYFMVPRFIETAHELPKTPSMRVKKFILQEQGNNDRTWALFVRFNLDVYPLIMPKDWPIFGMADGVPATAPFIYGWWFFLPAWLAKTFLGPRGWSNTAIVLTTVAFGAVFEAVAENLIFINPGRYAYTHVISGLAWAEGTPHQYPLDVPIWVGAYIGACCLILLRSFRVGSGQTQLSSKTTLLARLGRLRAFGGTNDRFGVNLAGTLILFSVFYFVSMIPALVIRYAHLRSVVGNPTPFGHMPWPWV